MARMIVSYDDISGTNSGGRIACSNCDMLSMARIPGPLYNIAGACSAVTRGPRGVCCLSVSTTNVSSSSFAGRRLISTRRFQIALWWSRPSHPLRCIVPSLRYHLVVAMGCCLSTKRMALIWLASLIVYLIRHSHSRDYGTSFEQHLRHLPWTTESMKNFRWSL